ncbi:MAG TPA: DEAD/DEAH box helicase, partial [Polyangiaceae bacterium]
MGKTFVALAVAFSILEARRENAAELGRCAKKILVLVPSNAALFSKWEREVGEFVKRCFKPEDRQSIARRFRAEAVVNPDDLVAALSQRAGAQVIIAKPSALRGKVQHFDAKAQLVLKALFTHWGNGFKKDLRRRLLAGAPPGWPMTTEELDTLVKDTDPSSDTAEALKNYFCRDEAAAAIEALREKALLAASEHFLERRRQQLASIRSDLVEVYKHALLRERLSRTLPLVIVDEAHNWKNHKNGYHEFLRFIAPRAQRLLLMTATPFQLRPDEMLKVLEAGDALKLPKERRERIKCTREQHLRIALTNAAEASHALSLEWVRLSPHTTQKDLANLWQTDGVTSAMAQLRAAAGRPGALAAGEIEATIDACLGESPPTLRAFMKRALALYAYNRDLSHELGEWVIRHRRSNDHRLVRVGHELDLDEHELAAQPGRHALHAAPGIDVRGEAELPHYLLMRATAELNRTSKKEQHRASLGCNLTGCYSTLFHSDDGFKLQTAGAGNSPNVYFDLLKELVGDTDSDARHPKMQAIVRKVVEHWEAGDKSLIFCFRTNTAKRLHELISAAIGGRLKARELHSLGGRGNLDRLRDRLQGRDRDLTLIWLDRVLWSLHWAPPEGEMAIHTDSFMIQPEDYREIARLALKFAVDLRADRLDRVFLNRAAECAQARRLRGDLARGTRTRKLLDAMADESWVHYPYGIGHATDDEGQQVIDEKGVHHVYEQSGEPTADAVEALKDYLLHRDRTAAREGRPRPVRSAFDGPSLWLGAEPQLMVIAGHDLPADVEQDLRDQRQFHIHLRSLTWNGNDLDWSTRALAMQAVRRAALRPDMLIRILPPQTNDGTPLSAAALADRVTQPLRGTGESLLRRLGVFLEDLASASGDITDEATARGALFDASRIRSGLNVALVDGTTPADRRNRYFSGFNTPLAPEVLICTSVGQEGIDLHRQCRHVFHYDLTWNPATLEQRTGRVDRIGCLAQRERQLEERTRSGNTGNGRTEQASVPRSL